MSRKAPWLVVGSAGQLGSDLVRALPVAGTVAVDLADVDITRPESVEATIAAVRPRVVVYAAAFARHGQAFRTDAG